LDAPGTAAQAAPLNAVAQPAAAPASPNVVAQPAAAPASPIVAPSAGVNADPNADSGQPRPKIALRKPIAQSNDPVPVAHAAAQPVAKILAPVAAAPVAAAPVAAQPIAKIQAPVAAQPIAAQPIARIPAPVTPPVAAPVISTSPAQPVLAAVAPPIATSPAPATNAWVTTPMDPLHVARVQADSNPGAAHRGTAPATVPIHPARSAPAAPPPIVAPPPPRSSSQRGAGRTLPIIALIGLLAAGATVAVLSSKTSDDPEPQPIPMPAPSTTLVAQDDPSGPPTGRSTPPGDPSPRTNPSTAPSDPTAPTTTATAPSGSPRQLGWIPASATEATETTALTADPTGDPLCRNSETLVNFGQAVAVTMEKEMREATKISDEEESRIGKRLEIAIAKDKSYAGKWDLPADVKKYGEYVGGLVRHIARGQRRAGITYRIHLARRSEFNAAALPGGVLLIHTGALEGSDAVHDEAELVAVLGHEIAHVEKRHTIAAYQYAKALFGDDAEAQIAMKIITMPISSQYEHEADERGLELAVEAQYDPQAAVNLWRRRARTESAAPGGLLGSILDGLMRSHPRAPLRACRAMKRVLWARDNAPWTRVYDGKTNLGTHIIGPQQTY